MSYEGLGLDVFDANETLGAIKLMTSKVLSNGCVHRIMGLASGKPLKRHDVRALISCAARSGPRFVPLLLLLLASYENLTAPNAIMQS